MLFVLIAFFQILGLTMLTTPLNRFLEQVFAYAPRLVGALLLLFVAVVTARIARVVVQRSLTAVRLDERLAVEPGEEAKPVSRGAANTVYWLVLIAGYVIGRLTKGVVSGLLTGIRFDAFVQSVGIRLPEGAKSPSEQMGQLTLVVVMYYAVMEASKILGLTLVADVLRNFLSFAGNIGAGLAIFVLGLYLAQVAANAVRASGMGQANLLAGLTRAVVLIFVGAIALRQMGIADEIVVIAFGLLMGAVAVAAALAFGLGGREVAARELENWLSRLRSNDRSSSSQ
jgi:hypothetical protein